MWTVVRLVNKLYKLENSAATTCIKVIKLQSIIFKILGTNIVNQRMYITDNCALLHRKYVTIQVI